MEAVWQEYSETTHEYDDDLQEYQQAQIQTFEAEQKENEYK